MEGFAHFEPAQRVEKLREFWHLDWAAAQFLSKQVHVGAVGYFYQQLSNDSGAPAILSNTKS
jgi:hypothetical protein